MYVPEKTRKTLALICALLLVPSLAFALVATNLEKSLFDPRLYEDALKASQFYEQLPALIAAQVEASATQSGGLPALLVGALPPDVVQNMFIKILPPETLQSLVERGIDQAVAYLNGKSGQAEVNLAGLRAQMAANSGGLVDQYFKSLPDCTLADALSLAGGLLGSGAELPKCNPPDAIRQAIAAPLQTALQEQLSQLLPESLSLIQGGDSVTGLLSAVRWVRIAAELTPLITLLLFALMTLLAIRTARDLLSWWGVPLLVGGILALVAGLLIGPVTSGFVNQAIASRLPATLVPAVAQITTQVAAAIAGGVARPIILDALLLSAVGGGLLLLWRFGPVRESVL